MIVLLWVPCSIWSKFAWPEDDSMKARMTILGSQSQLRDPNHPHRVIVIKIGLRPLHPAVQDQCAIFKTTLPKFLRSMSKR
jgi:hypothetical protein